MFPKSKNRQDNREVQRQLKLEQLEGRNLMSADMAGALAESLGAAYSADQQQEVAPHLNTVESREAVELAEPSVGLLPYRNSVNALDVSGDGRVTPFDAVQVLRYLVRHGFGQPAGVSPPYLDTTSPDNIVAPHDVLVILRHLALNGLAEGESSEVEIASTPLLADAETNEPLLSVASPLLTGDFAAGDERSGAGEFYKVHRSARARSMDDRLALIDRAIEEESSAGDVEWLDELLGK